MKQIEELGDKTIGIDIDGDKKPDFQDRRKKHCDRHRLYYLWHYGL